MFPTLKSHGIKQACLDLGLVKRAATDNDEGISTGQGLAMTAAGAAPFAGLIGQKKLIHDPYTSNEGARYSNIDELSRASRTGDVLITSKPGNSIWRHTMTPFSGTDFYHAQPVIGRHRGHGLTASAGDFHNPVDAKSSVSQLAATSQPVKAIQEDYTDVALLRPKNLTNAETRSVARQSTERLKRQYDAPNAAAAWLHDIFVPKLKNVAPDAGTICEGNVCSTVPSQALKDVAGKDVVPGTPAKYTMPADFLRSEEYELVGAHTPTQAKSRLARTVVPYAARGALGLGLAGATYAATENPEVAAVPAGMLAGNYAAQAALGPERMPKVLPKLLNPIAHRPANFSLRSHLGDVAKQVATHNLAPMAVGGGLAYGAMRALNSD